MRFSRVARSVAWLLTGVGMELFAFILHQGIEEWSMLKDPMILSALGLQVLGVVSAWLGQNPRQAQIADQVNP